MQSFAIGCIGRARVCPITDHPTRSATSLPYPVLDLSENRLRTVLESIGNLTTAQTWLHVGGNKLTALTELMLNSKSRRV